MFEAKMAVRAEEPLLIGLVGPPAGGKTFSALRLGKGMQQVRKGEVILIDTEGGRARKYADQFQFLHVNFEPPHRPDRFLEAIRAQLPQHPACIIVDSMSDEHEGEGGYLEFHDELVPKVGGNAWAAWAQPKAARKRLINGLLHIKVPLIFTFRAREKTQQDVDKGKTKIVNLGWMPVAPLEIVHSLDLTCILPPRADGVPVWESAKIGEDFIIKLPSFLAPFIKKGHQIDEDTGAALARWAKGNMEKSAAPNQTEEISDELLAQIDAALAKAAEEGYQALTDEWKTVHKVHQDKLLPKMKSTHGPNARRVDAERTVRATTAG